MVQHSPSTLCESGLCALAHRQAGCWTSALCFVVLMEIFLQFSGGKRRLQNQTAENQNLFSGADPSESLYPTWAPKYLGKFSEDLKLWLL